LFRRRPHHQRSIVVFALKMYKYSNLAGCSILSMPCRKALISQRSAASERSFRILMLFSGGTPKEEPFHAVSALAF
jgi:hypothetical protein